MRTAPTGLLRLWKPWYVWRPQQLPLRMLRSRSRAQPGYKPLQVAWGTALLADPSRAIGHCIWTTGVYDIAVTEVLTRLVRPGDTVVDAGANIGYMTVLSALLARPHGRVFAFEPNPELFGILSRNVEANARELALARVTCHDAALGERAGITNLALPESLRFNDGLAYVLADGDPLPADSAVATVSLTTVDDVLGDGTASLLKVDVEGHERRVLDGAARALEQHRITHVVFEDIAGDSNDAAEFLERAGYTMFSIGWSVAGLRLSHRSGEAVAKSYEPQSCLATIEPDDALRRCAPNGWSCLRRIRPRSTAVTTS